MHDPAVARPVLDRRDVAVLRQVGRDDEAAVDVLAVAGTSKSSSASRTRSGVPRVHSSISVDEESGAGAGSSRCAGLGPGDHGVDVLLTQRLVVVELGADPRRRLPGRHAPSFDDVGDVVGSLPRLFVGHQARTGRPGRAGGTPDSSSWRIAETRPLKVGARRPWEGREAGSRPPARIPWGLPCRPRRRRSRRGVRGSRNERFASGARRTGRRFGRGSECVPDRRSRTPRA